jgi:hypothetical protein
MGKQLNNFQESLGFARHTREAAKRGTITKGLTDEGTHGNCTKPSRDTYVHRYVSMYYYSALVDE